MQARVRASRETLGYPKLLVQRVWSVCGACVERVWSVCGACVERVWSVCGACVERVFRTANESNITVSAHAHAQTRSHHT
jgi:hypothetical protein